MDGKARGRRTARLACGVLLAQALLLVCGQAAAEPARGALFIPPLATDPSFARQAGPLRDLLAAGLLRTGQWVEALRPELEPAVQACIGRANRDVNNPGCWVPIGHGQGAQVLVASELRGDPAGCRLTVRWIRLETRLTERMHARPYAPCTPETLREAIGEAARTLLPEQDPAAGAAAPTEPTTSGLRPGLLLIESDTPGATVELRAPDGEVQHGTLPYRNPAAQTGRWAVTVSAPGRQTAQRQAEVLPGQATLLQLVLLPAGALRVTSAPPGVEVQLRRADGSPERDRTDGSTSGEELLAGPTPFERRDLAPGEYLVEVRASERWRALVRRVEVRADTQQTLALRLLPPCPDGMSPPSERAETCCWAGQTLVAGRCTGQPSGCPEGHFVGYDGNSCVLPPCRAGRERTDGVHCCWPGQRWDRQLQQCTGQSPCAPPTWSAGQGGCTLNDDWLTIGVSHFPFAGSWGLVLEAFGTRDVNNRIGRWWVTVLHLNLLLRSTGGGIQGGVFRVGRLFDLAPRQLLELYASPLQGLGSPPDDEGHRTYGVGQLGAAYRWELGDTFAVRVGLELPLVWWSEAAAGPGVYGGPLPLALALGLAL